jgi:hypothetical protein
MVIDFECYRLWTCEEYGFAVLIEGGNSNWCEPVF